MAAWAARSQAARPCAARRRRAPALSAASVRRAGIAGEPAPALDHAAESVPLDSTGENAYFPDIFLQRPCNRILSKVQHCIADSDVNPGCASHARLRSLGRGGEKRSQKTFSLGSNKNVPAAPSQTLFSLHQLFNFNEFVCRTFSLGDGQVGGSE